LLQHPVPSQIDERACFDAIDVNKDVDGVTCLGFGNMAMGEEALDHAHPQGIMSLLGLRYRNFWKTCSCDWKKSYSRKAYGYDAVNKNATVTICHSRTKDLRDHVLNADIVVGAVGIPKFIKSDWIKDNAVVIDAGYHPEKCGDIELEGIADRCQLITPVPGGVGPMTINTLILQTVEACERSIIIRILVWKTLKLSL